MNHLISKLHELRIPNRLHHLKYRLGLARSVSEHKPVRIVCCLSSACQPSQLNDGRARRSPFSHVRGPAKASCIQVVFNLDKHSSTSEPATTVVAQLANLASTRRHAPLGEPTECWRLSDPPLRGSDG